MVRDNFDLVERNDGMSSVADENSFRRSITFAPESTSYMIEEKRLITATTSAIVYGRRR